MSNAEPVLGPGARGDLDVPEASPADVAEIPVEAPVAVAEPETTEAVPADDEGEI